MVYSSNLYGTLRVYVALVSRETFQACLHVYNRIVAILLHYMYVYINKATIL